MQLDKDNPWPGLESFAEDAHAFFFGRDREIKALRNHVMDAPVTVLYGRSGLGKTSLLKAGLFPALRDENYLPIHVRFDLKPNAERLTLQLHHAVRDLIAATVRDAVLPSPDESLWEYLHRSDFELWSAKNYPLTPVIVLDQFEELFTVGTRVPELVDEFSIALGDLAENRIPADLASRIEADNHEAERLNLRSRNYKLLVSLREDFLPDLEGWCRLIPALARPRLRLRRLQVGEAFDAVRQPAAHMMSDELARKVVGIVAGENLHDESPDDMLPDDRPVPSEVEPALLSLFCRGLNEERKRLGRDGFDEQLIEYAKRDTLSNYYASCVRDMPPRVARFIETELITRNGFRGNYIREDAVPAHLTEDELDRLIGCRLLRLEDRYGAPHIELTHDVLTRAVRENRDRRLAEEEAAEAAERAERARRDYEEKAAEREAVLERERREERERRLESEEIARRFRRLSVVSAVLAIVCVFAVVLAGVAIWAHSSAEAARRDAEENSRDALAERLSAQGQSMLLAAHGTELEAISKLLVAQKISDNPGAGGLWAALTSKPELQQVLELPSEKSLLSADGRRVATPTETGIQMLNASTGEPIGMPSQVRHQT